MKNIILILVLFSNFIFAQNGMLNGKIISKNANKDLVGANVTINETQFHATSNQSGNFLIKNIPAGDYNVVVSYVGYKTENASVKIESGKETNLIIELEVTPISLGEVSVTSTRSEKLVREVPLPMEVVNEKKLEVSPYISTSDALKSEAGVSLTRDGIWATSVSIRGLSRNNIVTLVDGNRIETSTNLAAALSMIDINDIDRIEVIKGGASSLYGTGATGGVINIQTKNGFYDNQFRVNGSMTSGYNTVNKGALGNISLNIGDKNWYARISGTMRSAGNTETPEGTLPNSQFRDKSISAIFGFIPFEDHELKIDLQDFSANDVGIPGGDAFPATASARYLTSKRKMYSVEYRINNLIPNMANISAKYFYQFINREVELVPNANVTMRPGADHTTNGVQLQTNWLFGKLHFVTAGIDFWQREYNGHREKTIASLNRIIGDTPIPNSKYRSIGFYAQDEIRLIENKLRLTLGGRFDQINITSDEALNPAYIITDGVRNDNPPHDAQASFDAVDTDNVSWSGNIGLIYTVMKDIDLTLNAARTFRSPNLEERFQYIDLGGNIYLGNPNLDPEKGYFFDAGIRVWNPVISFRGNFFFNTFNDLVIDKEVITDSLFVKSNVGEARLYGFDLSLEYNFYNDFVFYTAVAYVRGEDTGNNQNLPEISPLNGTLGVRTKIANFVNADFAATVFTKQDKVAPGEEVTPGYATFDLFLNTVPIDLSLAKLQLSAGVQNLMDKSYRNHLATNRGMIRIEPGRNIFVKVKLSW